MEKTHWKKLYNPDYLGAYSLDKNGKYEDLTVTIESVINEMVQGAEGKKEECIVAKMKDNKPMVLNATNCKTLAKLFGSPHIEDWKGKKIVLYVAKVKAFGEVHDALRIRPTLPQLPELTPQHPKWEGAKKSLAEGNIKMDAIKKSFIVSPENEKLLCSK